MMMRTADFRDTDMNGIDDRDQPNFSGPSQNYLDQQERARNLLNPNLNQQVGNNPPRMPIEPIRRNPSPFGNNLSMGRFGGYNQPQPFMGGFGMPQMGYGGGFGYGMPQMGYGMQQMPFMGGFGGYGGGFGGFGMQPRMPQMGYGGFGGFGMPQMSGYGNPFGQSFYGGLGSFMGQPNNMFGGGQFNPLRNYGPPRQNFGPQPAQEIGQLRPAIAPSPHLQLRPTIHNTEMIPKIPRPDVGGGGRVTTMPIAPPGGFPRFGEDVGGGGRVTTMPIAPPGGFPRFNPS